jgi:hypothetical protein
MPSARILVHTPIQRTARVMQVEGMFDLPPTQQAELSWEVNLPLAERDWSLGLIVGPSGCGKTTVARQLFAQQLAAMEHLPPWPDQASILDAFPPEMPIRMVVSLLSSVGFSSPPAWLRPFRVLSTGEQFRVALARLLACAPSVAIMDEFTSVVDRTAAKIGSAALAKTVRSKYNHSSRVHGRPSQIAPLANNSCSFPGECSGKKRAPGFEARPHALDRRFRIHRPCPGPRHGRMRPGRVPLGSEQQWQIDRLT